MSSSPLSDAVTLQLDADNESTSTGPDKPRRGRPPGAKNKTKSATADKPKAEASVDPFAFSYTADPASIASSAALARTVWGLASLMLPVRPLTEDEGSTLGEALDPVLCRWLPIVGQWKYEAALVLCIYAMWDATKIEKPASESNAEVVNE